MIATVIAYPKLIASIVVAILVAGVALAIWHAGVKHEENKHQFQELHDVQTSSEIRDSIDHLSIDDVSKRLHQFQQ